MFALQKSKSKTSSRHQIAIRGVRDGILMLPNNEYRAILQVSSLNFELRSEEEQDAIIAELMAGQAKRLNEISHKGSAKERRRQARMEAEARATVETVTYHPQRPAPARAQE